MKILFLTNFYPPYQIGGYEALCQEAVDGLAERGHSVTVLTSTYGEDHPTQDGHIYRLLALESDLHFYRVGQALLYPQKRERNLHHLRSLLEAERPDIVFVWGMWNLSRRLAAEAERLTGDRVVYYLANPWPIEANMHQAYWDRPARSALGRLAKPLVRQVFRTLLAEEWQASDLRFTHALCCSAAQRDQLLEAGVPLRNAPVLYEGIDLEPYLVAARQRAAADTPDTLSLVFVGILAPHKGVHTAIQALGHLPQEKLARVRLTILGSGHPQYEAYLRRLVAEQGLGERVEFLIPIPRTELPAFLGRFEVLLLPSTWAEPLARIMQEGLAAGLVVVGTANGGTQETITDRQNGLLFAAEDSFLLAKHIESLLDSPALRMRLAEAGQRTAIERFDITRMVDEIEDYVQAVVEAERFPQSGVRVSVVIPTYNHARWVSEAVCSVLNQRYRDFEVIVVDDGSTDNTREVVAAFGDQVRYVWQENRGLSAARNTGIREALGAYVGVLDADDLYEPDYLSTLVPLLEGDPAAGAAYCGYRFVDERNAPLPQVEARDISPDALHTALLDGNFLVPESMLVRRHCYEAVGDFDEKLRACEDWDMWLRISDRYRVIHTARVLTRHRILQGSMSTDPQRMLTSRLMTLRKHIGDEPANRGGASHADRRAYGRAYLGSTVEYLQHDDDEGAYASFLKMAQICPELLEKYDTLYQLALGSQPKGSLGDFATLDMEDNRARLLGLLDRLFRDSSVKGSLAAFRRAAYANAWRALGFLNYGADRLPEARKCLLRAAACSPRVGFGREPAAIFVKSLVGQPGLSRLRQMRRSLRRIWRRTLQHEFV